MREGLRQPDPGQGADDAARVDGRQAPGVESLGDHRTWHCRGFAGGYGRGDEVDGPGGTSAHEGRPMGSLGESMTGTTTMKEIIEKELGEEVVAAAALSQGKPPSMLAMMTGAALIKLVSPRASKELPKRFILAVTADRAVAIQGTPISDEDGNDTGVHYRGEITSWPRSEVSAIASPDGKGGTLQIPGATIPVFDRSLGNPRERELFEALGA